MKARTTKQFWDCFDALPRRVQDAAREAYAAWQADPFDKSLQFKRLHSEEPLYSVRIGIHWRALGLRDDDVVTWIWIGSHADYDRMIRRR